MASLFASAIATCRKLKFKASAEGHDRESRILLTARFDALFKALVREGRKTVFSLTSSFAAPEILLYALEREASAGAMQKSISFT